MTSASVTTTHVTHEVGGGELTPAAVDDWLDERVAPFKRPKTVLVVDALPRNSMGKVRRSTIGAELGLEEVAGA